MNHDAARDLFARALHRVAPEIELSEIRPTAPLQDEMDLDSMDFLNVAKVIAEETGYEIPESDYRLLTTVDGYVSYLADHV